MDENYEENRSNPRDWVTPIIGAVIILIILIGGWQLLRNRQQEEEPSPIGEVIELTPTPTPTPTATPGAQVTQLPDGTTQLPDSGFPAPVVAGASLLALAAGWKLRKIRS